MTDTEPATLNDFASEFREGLIDNFVLRGKTRAEAIKIINANPKQFCVEFEKALCKVAADIAREHRTEH
jgi:hypothetical protein